MSLRTKQSYNIEAADDFDAVGELLKVKAPREYKIVRELASAKQEIERLQKLHLERTKFTDQIISERDVARENAGEWMDEVTRANAELARLKEKIEAMNFEIGTYEADIKALTSAGETWQGHAEANHALLMRAEGRIKELEEILSGKRIADVIGENNDLRERERRLVVAGSALIEAFNSNLGLIPLLHLSRMDGIRSAIETLGDLIEAHKGGA